MGMTINNIIKGLQSIKAFLDYSEFKGLEEQTKVQCFVLDEAIDTMRKYQQIEEIVKQYKKFGNIDFTMQIISGVVEDGNDD